MELHQWTGREPGAEGAKNREWQETIAYSRIVIRAVQLTILRNQTAWNKMGTGGSVVGGGGDSGHNYCISHWRYQLQCLSSQGYW